MAKQFVILANDPDRTQHPVEWVDHRDDGELVICIRRILDIPMDVKLKLGSNGKWRQLQAFCRIRSDRIGEPRYQASAWTSIHCRDAVLDLLNAK